MVLGARCWICLLTWSKVEQVRAYAGQSAGGLSAEEKGTLGDVSCPCGGLDSEAKVKNGSVEWQLVEAARAGLVFGVSPGRSLSCTEACVHHASVGVTTRTVPAHRTGLLPCDLGISFSQELSYGEGSAQNHHANLQVWAPQVFQGLFCDITSGSEAHELGATRVVLFFSRGHTTLEENIAKRNIIIFDFQLATANLSAGVINYARKCNCVCAYLVHALFSFRNHARWQSWVQTGVAKTLRTCTFVCLFQRVFHCLVSFQ